jgi:hypothetical protein
MLRLPLSSLALLVLLVGCAGSHKPAEAPDFTEKESSDPSPELTSAKADRPIQAEGASATSTAAAAPAEGASAPVAASAPAPDAKPDGTSAGSATDAAIIAGNALPPPPPTTGAAKAHKAKKAKKGAKTKKSAKSTP